jgi:ubiquinone biosynthesis protein
LLQKTLLYIEGLGRQLYPQLDLWQTAKPFLENWLKEQIGLKAMYSKISTNLPFWSEKLPEIPDLVYDSLKQVKTLPEQHRVRFEQQQIQFQKQHSSMQWMVIGATFFVVSSILPIHQSSLLPSFLSGLAGLGCWLIAWKIKKA